MFDIVERFFTCDLTGNEYAIVIRDGVKICVTADEGWDIEAQSQARHDAWMHRSERGY